MPRTSSNTAASLLHRSRNCFEKHASAAQLAVSGTCSLHDVCSRSQPYASELCSNGMTTVDETICLERIGQSRPSFTKLLLSIGETFVER